MPRKGLLAAGAVAAVAMAATAALVGRELLSPADQPKSSTPKARGFVKVQDPQTGFSISYPRGWRRLPSGDDQVRLLVAGGRGASLLVRTAPLGLKVRPENLKSAKKLTDRLVKKGENVKLLRRAQPVQSGGLPGYLYLYTFTDRASGQRGAHAHYFLFRDELMFTLVFQAVPSTTFAGLAPLFDRIANTFQATPASRGAR